MPEQERAPTDPGRTTLLHIGVVLLLLSLGLFGGTTIELIAARHYDERTQLIPFAMCAVGIVSVLIAVYHPTRATFRLLQAVLAIALIVSVVGIYFHVTANIAFLTDFQPDATWREKADAAFHGRDPILAPGILALASGIGLLGLRGLMTATHPESALATI